MQKTNVLLIVVMLVVVSAGAVYAGAVLSDAEAASISGGCLMQWCDPYGSCEYHTVPDGHTGDYCIGCNGSGAEASCRGISSPYPCIVDTGSDCGDKVAGEVIEHPAPEQPSCHRLNGAPPLGQPSSAHRGELLDPPDQR